MVMAVPTPQCVGQEFVRQYYTLLNKDPNQLHRFYNKDSIFLHGRGHTEDGAPENPVFGQEDIYSKIKDLNFIDCRAKIRQVDSHPTVSGGVVVQVSGELSNDGKPMRKFTQTFVLAPGDMPKKYFVHNDIFRYQDDVFPEENSDETAEGTVESEGEEENGHQLPLNNGVGAHEQSAMEPVLTPQETNAPSIYYGEEMAEQRSNMIGQDVYPDDEENQELQEVVIDKQQPEIHHIEPVAPQAPEPILQDLVPDDTVDPLDDVPTDPKEVEISVDSQEPQLEIQPEMSLDAIDDVEERPKTWADLASRNAPVKAGVRPAMKPQVAQQPQQTTGPSIPSPPRPQQPSTGRGMKDNRPLFGTRESRMNARNAPDSHQVFIGNLPVGVSNEEVHEVFGKFGHVIEIRLNPKNFGFVIFDSADPVEQVLAKRPIKIGNHEINIEEKKPSGTIGRGGGAGSRRGDSAGGMGTRGRGGQRGGQARGGGGFGGGGRGGNAGPGSSGRGGRRGSGGRGGGVGGGGKMKQ